MADNLDLSIIIISWNTQSHLVDCLSSFGENQGKYGQEIIVVDNGSSDGSPETVEKEFPQVKLIRNEENLGFARANNIGIHKSMGRYICLINSDMVILEDCINNLVEFMEENPNVGMAGPRILNPDRTLQPSCRHLPSIWNNLCQTIGLNYIFPKFACFSEPLMKYWAHDTERKVDVLSGCFWMVRREAIDDVGLLDEDFFIYGEDIDWCKRFHKQGWDVVFYPGADAIHFHGASSSNDPVRFYLEMQKADLHYWRKHHGRLGQLTYRMIILVRQLVRIPVFALTYIFWVKNRSIIRFKLKRAFACIGFLFGFAMDR